jgi:hypothetical protein
VPGTVSLPSGASVEEDDEGVGIFDSLPGATYEDEGAGFGSTCSVDGEVVPSEIISSA